MNIGHVWHCNIKINVCFQLRGHHREKSKHLNIQFNRGALEFA